jgi:hypothetical protein
VKYYAYAVVSKENPLIQRATLETEASARDFIKVYGDENHSIVRLTSSDAEALELAVERATANMIAAQNRAAELEKALRDAAVQVGVHFDKRYTMNGFLAKDEHGELCYFNDILDHIEQYTKKALEGK